MNCTPTVRPASHPAGFETQLFASHQDGHAEENAALQAAHAEILHRAYSIWESKGRLESGQLEDWLEAEAEVLSET